MMNEITRVQIFRYVTKDKILDVSDMLSLEPKRNKLAITLLEYDENFHAKQKVKHFVDADHFKVVCWDILHNQFEEWVDHKGSVHNDAAEARVLTIRKDTRYRNPYAIKIDNGVGEVIGQGAVKMAKQTDTLSILLPDFEAKRLALTVLDYVRAWETVNFKKRREANTVLIPTDGMPDQVREREPEPEREEAAA